MLTKLHIENFKSIHNLDIELGKVNVFIGENGCGKSNILEAVALASAAKSDRLKNDDLAAKGIRVTRPNMMMNSFKGTRAKENININLTFSNTIITTNLTSESLNDIDSPWLDNNILAEKKAYKAYKVFEEKYGGAIGFIFFLKALKDRSKDEKEKNPEAFKEFFESLEQAMSSDEIAAFNNQAYKLFIADFIIYELQTNPLRGFNKQSYEIPGRNGENLDLLLGKFSEEEWEQIIQHSKFISWLDDNGIIVDKDGELAGKRLKLRSDSKLYFRDKFMQKKNNVFSVENANEGALHILFYLALFISKKTPSFFAIDNIENALNPYLCRHLMKNLAELANKNEKQALITTHNPAILDGLNLHDDNQRLFVVSRNKKGHTTVKRIQLKPEVEVGGKKLKLSELWMRNHLGGIPQNF